MLKKILLVGVAVALVVTTGVAAVWLWGQLAAPAAAQTAEPATAYNTAHVITVVGNGTASIKPDIARVSIGVEITAPTVAEAMEQNETQMKSVLAAIRAAGIADKDIQTSNFSISSERYPEPMPVEGGVGSSAATYRVSNMVTVTIRDLDNVGAVLDAVIEAGANNIWGVSFTLEDLSAAQALARGEAIDDARARAEALAELSGVQLGPVMSVSEVVGGNMPLAYSVVKEAAYGADDVSVSPGELEIGYQVQVSYFIEP